MHTNLRACALALVLFAGLPAASAVAYPVDDSFAASEAFWQLLKQGSTQTAPVSTAAIPDNFGSADFWSEMTD